MGGKGGYIKQRKASRNSRPSPDRGGSMAPGPSKTHHRLHSPNWNQNTDQLRFLSNFKQATAPRVDASAYPVPFFQNAPVIPLRCPFHPLLPPTRSQLPRSSLSAAALPHPTQLSRFHPRLHRHPQRPHPSSRSRPERRRQRQRTSSLPLYPVFVIERNPREHITRCSERSSTHLTCFAYHLPKSLQWGS